MLILEPDGNDAENIKMGSTLSDDQLAKMRFDYQITPKGMAGFVLADDSMSPNQFCEGDIRRDLHPDLRAESGLVAKGRKGVPGLAKQGIRWRTRRPASV